MESYKRHKFYSRVQQVGESFDSFLVAVHGLSAMCNFHKAEKDKATRDRIVTGIRSETVRDELFNVDGNLTLKKVIQICQRTEATKH